MCPGCGAYAPDIAPLADGTPAPAVATDAATRQAPLDLWNDVDHSVEESRPTPQDLPYDSDGSHDIADAPALAPQGRAARRRQRERWKKTQRKALVATAVALVGGGMTVASLNRQAPDRTQATSVPDREPMGIAEEQVTDTTPDSSTPIDRHRSERASSATRASTANSPHEQAAAAPRATPPTRVTHQKSVAVQLKGVTASAESQGASTMSEATDTAARTETTASPTPTAADDTAPSGTDTSSATPSPSEDSSTPPSSSASSPELCLLGLLCIS
jgi:hypothetical protein